MLSVTNGEFQNSTGIHICTKHTGKMKGLWSLSTSPLNPICTKRAMSMNYSVCTKCYSMAMQKRYPKLSSLLTKNLELLSERILCDDELPDISNKSGMFRYESFGDSVAEFQVVNYFKTTGANPETDCALWTKNPWIIKNAIDKYHLEKPKNLTIIGSSYNINEPMTEFYSKYDFIDYIFTVYDKKFIKEHNVDINCGGRSCLNCQRCYRRSHDGYEIREILK